MPRMAAKTGSGRFKSQALLDEGAVLMAMRYVDLNPIRAGIAERPEASEHTSIRQRIRRVGSALAEAGPASTEPKHKVPLLPLVKAAQDPHPNALGRELHDYLEPVRWAGRAIRHGKRGRPGGDDVFGSV